ncbi:hypothetical protein BN131_2210 [Cronobacter malonaticus 681]|nr:hypothetical protein BN131_2210 [Cronobacter malonaticus 681]
MQAAASKLSARFRHKACQIALFFRDLMHQSPRRQHPVAHLHHARGVVKIELELARFRFRHNAAERQTLSPRLGFHRLQQRTVAARHIDIKAARCRRRAVHGLQIKLHFRGYHRINAARVKLRQKALQHNARLQRAACAVGLLHREQQLGVMRWIACAGAQRAADRQTEPVRLALREGAFNNVPFHIHRVDRQRKIAALGERAQAVGADALAAPTAVQVMQINIDMTGVRIFPQVSVGFLAKRDRRAVRRARQHPGIQQCREHNRFLAGRCRCRAKGFKPGSKGKGKHKSRFL